MKKPTMEELCRDINHYESISEKAEYPDDACWEELESCTYSLETQEQKIIINHYRKLAGWLYRDLEDEKKKKENK